MFKHVNSIFFFLAIILPIVLCQSNSSTTVAPDRTTVAPETTTVAETTTKAPIPQNDVATTVSQLTEANQVIQDAKLSPVATGVKILLTPVVYLVRGLLFVVELLLKGVLIIVKILVDGLVKALGLGALLDVLDPTLDTVTKLVFNLLDNVSCLLASLAYGPPLMECPPKPVI